MTSLSALSQRLRCSRWFRSSGQALVTPVQGLAPAPDDPGATVPAHGVLLGAAISSLSSQANAAAKATSLPEGVLLQQLFALTEAKPFMRVITKGLEDLLHESDGRLGFQMRLGHQLNLPLQLLVDRPELPGLEPLATIQAGVAGNMIFRSCAAQLSTPICRPRDTRAVLGNLRRQACQLHLL